MQMLMKQGTCFFCGTNSSIESSVQPFGTFYNCPVCGRYIIMFNQTVTTFPISKDKVAAYLFYNNSPLVIKKEKQIRTCLIGTNTQIEFYSAQDARYDVVSCEEIESFYPATLEDRVKKIMMLLKKMTPSFGRSIKLSGAELVSCFFMQRYAENGNRLSQNALNSQCSAIYSYLSSRKYIKNSIKYSLQGTTQGRYLTGGVPPVRFSM